MVDVAVLGFVPSRRGYDVVAIGLRLRGGTIGAARC